MMRHGVRQCPNGQSWVRRSQEKVFCAAVVAALVGLGCGSRTSAPPADAAPDSWSDAAVSDSIAQDRLGPDASGADAPMADAGWDATVVVPDGGEPNAQCAAAGGVLCTLHRWDICPAGTEPVAGNDPHLGCGEGGWCCQIAPPSPCSLSGQGNCIPDACTGCWFPVQNLACEAGRVCCQDMCD